jgi:hypothetical protein
VLKRDLIYFVTGLILVFNAYCLSDYSEEIRYADISPVNTFRLIFNSYFRMNFERLDDASYFSTSPTPYQFEQVDIPDRVDCVAP